MRHSTWSFRGAVVSSALGVVVLALSTARAGDDPKAEPAAPAAAPEAVAVDKEAPDFTLKDHEGHTFHLKDLRGKRHVLLAFFPRAFTPG